MQLTAATEANTQEAGADVKKVVYCQVPAMWKMGTHVTKPISWEDGDSCLKAHLPLSVEAEVCIRAGRGTEERDQGRGLKSSPSAESVPVRSVMGQCMSPWFSHPGFPPSWLHG